MIMTKKEDGTYKQVGFIYRNDEINVGGEVPVNFKTMDGVIGDYTIKGNTYQSDGVSPDMPQEVHAVGDKTANLFDSAWEQGIINATTGQNEAEGTFMRTKDYIPIKPNIAYSFSRNISNGFMNVRLYRADKSYIGSGTASTIRLISGASVGNPMGNNISFCCFEVIDSEASYIRFNDSSNNTATKWLMIEGEYTQQTMPKYEPYGYKIPVETRGKNLFDGWEISKTFLGLTCETSENMTIVLNGTRIAGQNAQPITRPNITLKAGTYTVSCKMIGGSMEGVTDGVFFGINQSTYAQRTSPAVLKVGDIGKRTFTLNEDTVISSFDITPSYGSPGAIFTDATFECQFEYGSEATEYKPYHESIITPIYLDKPLYKISDYADSINYAEQKAERAVKKLVLTGAESITEDIEYNRFYFTIQDMRSEGVRLTKLFCTHYQNISDGRPIANVPNNSIYTGGGTDSQKVFIKTTDHTTVADFKSYLTAQYANGTPVKVYYILAEPETESVTLPKIPTLDGTNIIDINTEIKPSNISLSRPMTEIKKILNKEGKILFEKGFTREVESVLPLTLNGIGKPLKDYDIEGNTEQRNYSGKNLIRIIPFKTTFGTNSTVIRDFLNSLGVGTYMISYNIELLTRDDTTDNSTYGIRVINELGDFGILPGWGSASVGTIKKVSLKITITEDNKGKFTNVYFYGCGIFSVGVTGSAQIYDFQLEAGTEATSYEPYVGGTPSPNPDYPQEVKAVGDRTANLFDKTSDIVDFYISSETGVYTATTGNSRSILIKCSPKTTYTVYVPTNATLRMVTFDQYPTSGDIGSDYIHKPTDYYVDKTLSITTGTTAQYLCIFCYNSVQEATQYDENEYFSQIMLNEGETALPYEPYGYKIPEETRGKNLFDKNDCTVVGYINSEGKVMLDGSDWFTNKNYIKCSGVITITALNGLGSVAHVACYDEQKNLLGACPISDNNSNQSTIALVDGTIYIKACSRRNNLDSFLLELGSTATEYEPYHESIITPIYLDSPLYKIGDYADTYGMTEEVRAIKELVLTGEENYKLLEGSNAYGIITFYIEQTHLVPTDMPIGWCSHFPESNESYQTVKIESFGLSNKDRIYIRVSNNRIKTIEELAQWIKEQYNNGTPVKVYYILATPETESVTLPKIPTLDGTTVIDVKTEIEPSNMYVKYKSSK